MGAGRGRGCPERGLCFGRALGHRHAPMNGCVVKVLHTLPYAGQSSLGVWHDNPSVRRGLIGRGLYDLRRSLGGMKGGWSATAAIDSTGYQ